jgi:DNA adenine methylase
MNTVLKYPGSKWNLAHWIISNFPDRYEKMTYLEPFFGSGAVFFNKKRSIVETINDLDSNVVNLFRVIRNRPEELARMVQFTPWSREEYQLSYKKIGDELEDARRFMVRMWQAIGAKSSDRTGWRNNIKSMNGNCAQWANVLPENIIAISDRLKHTNNRLVQIENQPAAKLIERYRRKNVFIYADPPYVRSARGQRIYAYEMTDEDHIKLLGLLCRHPGPVMISGYESDLYTKHLKGWRTKAISTNCEAGGVRREIIWMNYEPPARQLEFEEIGGGGEKYV